MRGSKVPKWKQKLLNEKPNVNKTQDEKSGESLSFGNY